MSKKTYHCPVCGRFTSKENRLKFDELMLECKKLSLLNDAADLTIEELRKEVGIISHDNIELKREIEYLRNRGFWARLFNLD